MKRNLVLALASLALLVTVLLFKFSGMAENITNLSNVNIIYIIPIILVFPLFFSIISLYTIYIQKIERLFLLIPVVFSILIFILFGISYFSIFISLALILATFINIKTTLLENQLYKKPMIYRVSSYSAKRAFLLLNILIVVGVFVSLSSNVSLGENMMDVFMDNVINSTISQQELPPGVSTEKIKEELKNRVEGMEAILQFLPALAAISLWATLEFLKTLILTPLAGIYSSLGWRLLIKDKDKKLTLDKYGYGK